MGEHCFGQSWLPVDQRTRIKGRKQPFVRINYQRVGILNSAVELLELWHENRRKTVGSIDVKPKVLFAGKLCKPV